MDEIVNTEGLKPAKVLAALYDNARAQGMGLLHYTPKPMDESEAEKLLSEGTYFDYVHGRVLKVNLRDPNGLGARLYDRDNGHGAAQRVIDKLRTDSVTCDKAS